MDEAATRHRVATRADDGARRQATVSITRRTTFAAGHILRNEAWDEARNREVFGGCSTDHGHNYVLEVTVAGPLDPATGMVVNLKRLGVREAIPELWFELIEEGPEERLHHPFGRCGVTATGSLELVSGNHRQMLTRQLANVVEAVAAPPRRRPLDSLGIRHSEKLN